MNEPVTAKDNVCFTRQTVNILRQILSAPGWAKSPKDFYVAGKLLAETLPEYDLSFVKPPEVVALMSAAEKTAYLAADKEWAGTVESLSAFSKKETETIVRALEAMAPNIPNNKHTFALYQHFGVGAE